MDRLFAQSNDRSDNSDNKERGPLAAHNKVTPRTVNERFVAYLQEVYAPRNPRRLSLMTLGVVGGVSVSGLAALALVRELHSLWPLIALGVVLTVRAALSLHQRLATRHRLFRVREVIENGVPVQGYLVQAPPALFRPGLDNLSCLVLFSFQPEVGADTAYMSHLAARLYGCKDRKPGRAEQGYLASLTADDKPVLYRRRLLPFGFTDGSTVYCADLQISRAYIRGGYLAGDSLPLLAQTGDSGGVELVPWWLTDQDDPSLPTASRGGSPAAC